MQRLPLLLVLLLSACAGGGPYGFSPQYVQTNDEEAALESVTEVGYEDVRRDPNGYAETTISWFGIVTSVDESGVIEMTYRTLAPRNICSDATDASCRVTVSARAGGPFTARVQLRPEDAQGEDRVWNNSLIRIVGRPTQDFDERGGPILEANYYRHWPRGAYVTTAARSSMRR